MKTLLMIALLLGAGPTREARYARSSLCRYGSQAKLLTRVAWVRRENRRPEVRRQVRAEFRRLTQRRRASR